MSGKQQPKPAAAAAAGEPDEGADASPSAPAPPAGAELRSGSSSPQPKKTTFVFKEPEPKGRVRYNQTQTSMIVAHYDRHFKDSDNGYARCAQSLSDKMPETFSALQNYHVRRAFVARDRQKDGSSEPPKRTGRPSILPNATMQQLEKAVDNLINTETLVTLRTVKHVIKQELQVGDLTQWQAHTHETACSRSHSGC
jgi:hypothetical protein